jgi:hypothetical protein
LFLATSPQEITYVYAELWQQMLLEEEVREIKIVLQGHIPQPGIVDPLASTPNKLTETTAMDEYRRLGLAVNPATKDPVNGIRAVKATLKARDKHKNPVIFFNPALRRTLYEISRGFAWDETENRPIKKNDDMMECLHRLCLQGLTYIEPAGEGDYAIIAPRDFDAYVRAIVISGKLSDALAATGGTEDEIATQISTLVSAKAAELEIKINPKYGIWNNDLGDIEPVDSAGDAIAPTE